MWIEIGHFAALTALLAALMQWVAPIVGLRLQRPAWIRVGEESGTTDYSLQRLIEELDSESVNGCQPLS
ncbi:MAG: hypothetical protein HQL66_13825 [Magnetococcales bacterium]|nr:hypothetical protein [Magnetococcales bacterium]